MISASNLRLTRLKSVTCPKKFRNLLEPQGLTPRYLMHKYLAFLSKTPQAHITISQHQDVPPSQSSIAHPGRIASFRLSPKQPVYAQFPLHAIERTLFVHCAHPSFYCPFILSFTAFASFSISSAFLITSSDSVFLSVLSTYCFSSVASCSSLSVSFLMSRWRCSPSFFCALALC